jgi:hypothetical protein
MHVLRDRELCHRHENPIVLREVATGRFAPAFSENAFDLFLIMDGRVEEPLAFVWVQGGKPVRVTPWNHKRVPRHQPRIAENHDNVRPRIIDDPVPFRIEVAERAFLFSHFPFLSCGNSAADRIAAESCAVKMRRMVDPRGVSSHSRYDRLAVRIFAVGRNEIRVEMPHARAGIARVAEPHE